MELLECPNCGGFVRRDWDECHSCGAELSHLEQVGGTGVQVEAGNDSTGEETTEDDRRDVPEDPADPPPARLRLPDFVEPSTPPAGDATDDRPEPELFSAVSDEPLTSSNGWVERLVSAKATIAGVTSLSVLALVVLVLSTLTITSGEPAAVPTVPAVEPVDSWPRFTDAEARFSVDTPTPPAVRQETVEGNPSTVTESETPDRSSLVSVRLTEADRPWSQEDKVLTDAMKREATRSSSKVVSQLVSRNGDRRQLDATLRSESKQTISRTWVSGNYLVEVTVVSNDGRSRPELFTRFADSLVIRSGTDQVSTMRALQ